MDIKDNELLIAVDKSIVKYELMKTLALGGNRKKLISAFRDSCEICGVYREGNGGVDCFRCVVTATSGCDCYHIRSVYRSVLDSVYDELDKEVIVNSINKALDLLNKIKANLLSEATNG